MSWRFLEDRATADIAFLASGGTLEELFRSAVDAATSAMISDLSSLEPRERREVALGARDIDMLLFDLLQEVIFFKDVESLLVRLESARVSVNASRVSLVATLCGEKIDPRRHELLGDVKGVALYRYRVRQASGGWEAEVILDM
jgi:SHS2 domain-containing protein